MCPVTHPCALSQTLQSTHTALRGAFAAAARKLAHDHCGGQGTACYIERCAPLPSAGAAPARACACRQPCCLRQRTLAQPREHTSDTRLLLKLQATGPSSTRPWLTGGASRTRTCAPGASAARRSESPATRNIDSLSVCVRNSKVCASSRMKLAPACTNAKTKCPHCPLPAQTRALALTPPTLPLPAHQARPVPLPVWSGWPGAAGGARVAAGGRPLQPRRLQGGLLRAVIWDTGLPCSWV